MYVKDFKKWALEWYDKYCCSSRYIGAMTIKQTTIVIDTRTGKFAIAKCHKKDRFSTHIGIGVAYARLKGVQIPQETPQIKDLPNNAYFTRESCLKYQKIGVDIETDNIVVKRCFPPYDLKSFSPDILVKPCEK